MTPILYHLPQSVEKIGKKIYEKYFLRLNKISSSLEYLRILLIRYYVFKMLYNIRSLDTNREICCSFPFLAYWPRETEIPSCLTRPTVRRDARLSASRL
jgi:hypothetical protein